MAGTAGPGEQTERFCAEGRSHTLDATSIGRQTSSVFKKLHQQPLFYQRPRDAPSAECHSGDRRTNDDRADRLAEREMRLNVFDLITQVVQAAFAF